MIRLVFSDTLRYASGISDRKWRYKMSRNNATVTPDSMTTIPMICSSVIRMPGPRLYLARDPKNPAMHTAAGHFMHRCTWYAARRTWGIRVNSASARWGRFPLPGSNPGQRVRRDREEPPRPVPGPGPESPVPEILIFRSGPAVHRTRVPFRSLSGTPPPGAFSSPLG